VQLYLPIADIPVNVFLILAMGAAVGFVSGMFGIGGGFLMTPLLIFIGVQPAVAVASVTTHVAASSFSGAIAYWRRNAIDMTLALTLLAGGGAGDDEAAVAHGLAVDECGRVSGDENEDFGGVAEPVIAYRDPTDDGGRKMVEKNQP